MSYSDSKMRPLTVEDSPTNTAYIIFNKMMPMERYEIMKLVDSSLTGTKKQNACLNYIEDNLDKFKRFM